MQFNWLASYPKSGNTWVRIFLSNYLTETGNGWAWNDRLIGLSSHLERHRFDEGLSIASADIPPPMRDKFRRQYHAQFARKFADVSFAKTHETFISPRDDQPMFASGDHCKAIYLIRNPLDIAPSFAQHENCSIDQIIVRMADDTAAMPYGDANFGEHLGGWSAHVSEWADQSDLDTLVLRYEDLIAEPEQNFQKLVEFSGLELDQTRLTRAVQASQFSKLQSAEQAEGFAEVVGGKAPFFRRGSAGAWSQELSDEQVRRIKSDHAAIMQRFGYL